MLNQIHVSLLFVVGCSGGLNHITIEHSFIFLASPLLSPCILSSCLNKFCSYLLPFPLNIFVATFESLHFSFGL